MSSSLTRIESTAQTNGHSAEVRMRLLVNGSCLRIAQMGPDFLILREDKVYPPSDAEVIFSVDGNEERWMVRLPSGICPDVQRTPVSKI
jgi:hypothetical protein